MEGRITFEREALYAEVWTDPISTVSKRYGLSDNGLRKICKRLGVPMPPLGYWARIRSGQRIARPKLPRHDGPTTFESYPDAHSYYHGLDPSHIDTIRDIDQDESEPARLVVPTADGMYRHRLIRAIAKKLESVDRQIAEEAKPRKRTEIWEPNWDRVTYEVMKPGGLIDVGGEYVAVIVTPAQRMRALAIADAFLIAVEERGFEVKLEDGKTTLSCKDVSVIFRMSEMAAKVREGYTNETWDAFGRLRIILRSGYHSPGPMEMKIRDEPDSPIEDQLNSLLIRLRRAVLGHEDRANALKVAQKRAEQERVEAERRRWHEDVATGAAQREVSKIQAVFSEADQWDLMERRRRYLDHIEHSARDRGIVVDQGTPVGEWLAWARSACLMWDPVDVRLKQLQEESHEQRF